MNQFISCDWGTTSLRLRLIENETQNILAEVVSHQGIADTYSMWKKTTSDRFLFYETILTGCIQQLSLQIGYSLCEIPIIISGMASSTIGMLELNYADLPVKTDGNGLIIHKVKSSNRFKHSLLIVSGVKTKEDVMRGEETIITGCEIKNTNEEELFILPGTHSKHVLAKNGMIKDCKTYMTGELFDLLSTKSVLSDSVEKGNSLAEASNPYFEKGVKEGASDNLLNRIFQVRTNRLFNKLSLDENYYYLSGLLIGTELKELLNKNYKHITLVSDEKFFPLYLKAFHLLKINKNIHHINSDAALIKGQSIIYKNNVD